uniref:Lipase 1-like n=1 Tax=Drosophila rhopaloa TaxID=1041015 RepID=A0A6P4E010_DRORH
MSLVSTKNFFIVGLFLIFFQPKTNANFNPFQLVIPPNVLEDAELDTFQLISKYGYPAENYTVQTEDGYILGMVRIARPGAIPVLMVHGLLDSSATWVMMGPTKSLGYLLYEQGYDVWMTNVRGNTYSKKHVRYSTLDSETPAKFQLFDYGLWNLLYYGSLRPPSYKLENVRTKVALYYGNNDWLAPPEDVELLYQRLPYVVDKYVVPNKDFNHLDLIWGIDAKTLLWDRMIQVMKSQEPYPVYDDYSDYIFI